MVIINSLFLTFCKPQFPRLHRFIFFASTYNLQDLVCSLMQKWIMDFLTQCHTQLMGMKSSQEHILWIVPPSIYAFLKPVFSPFFCLYLYAMKEGAYPLLCFSSVNCNFAIVYFGTLLLQNLEQIMESMIKQLL